LGVDYVELDIQQTADKCLVAMHDKFIDRTTNGSGLLSSLALNQVKVLDAGRGEPVPTLPEILSAATGRVGLILESISRGIGLEIVDLVQRTKFLGHVIYSSFLHDDILAIRNTHANVDTMALLEGVPVLGPAFALDAKATYVGASIESITHEYIDEIHAANLRIFVYTLNDDRVIQEAKRMGVDGIISDFPDRIISPPELTNSRT